MISAEDFSFQYPTVDEWVLDDVSFAVEDGTVLGVVGPVEAGKTTLAMALAGFAPRTTGGVTEGDLRVAGRDPREADDDRVAMVFEDYSSQLTQIRTIDEVIAPLTNTGTPREEAERRAEELLDRVRLSDAAEKFTWELSGGQQQRLAIAAALAIEPEVLVFDTATDMLDPEGKETVSELVAALAGETTLVVTENDPNSLVGLADEVLVLDEGERVAFGDADEILRDADLLRSVGVGAPLPLSVAESVGLGATPVSVGEFVEEFEERVGDERVPDDPSEVTAVLGDESDPRGTVPDRRVATVGDGAVDDWAVGARNAPDGGFGDVLVDVRDVTYEYYDGTVAVEDLDLQVRAGEVHAILGGNGAGKTTTSKLLVGLLNPTSGTVRVSGTDTATATARELAASVGIALQNPLEQLSRRSVDAELRYPLERRRYERAGLRGLFRKRERFDEAYVEERVETAAELVGIDDLDAERDPIFLPRGEQRLVTMASSLVLDPGALVFDEPVAGVDATARRSVRGAIERLRQADKAVVLIEHDMEFVAEVADTVTVLDDGEVARQGPVREVFGVDNWNWLAERYLRPPLAARLAHQVGVDATTRDELVDRLAPALEVP